jgi:hypothetical protein
MRKTDAGYEKRERERRRLSKERRLRREATVEKEQNKYKGRGALKCGLCGKSTTKHPVGTWCEKMKP